MKYMAIIDADEKPVSCEFIGCNGNVAPYLIGATDNIKALEQESVLDKIRAEIMQLDYNLESVDYDQNDMAMTEEVHMICREELLQIIDRYRVESEE